MWCAVRIADDCWRQVWADTSVTIGMVWYGMAWQGTVKYDMVWQGMVCVDTSSQVPQPTLRSGLGDGTPPEGIIFFGGL